MKRVYGLDILRAVAIIRVIIGHSAFYFGWTLSENKLWFDFGDGVNMFFVLSGFLIGSILFTKINNKFEFKDLTNFWLRRWMRTLPAYFFILIILMIDTKQFHPVNFTFTQTFFEFNKPFYGESWSLCIEEWFYLLVPFIFFLSIRVKRSSLLFWIVLIIISVTAYRIYKGDYSLNFEQFQYKIKLPTVMRLDSIMYGVLSAYISIYHETLWNRLKSFFSLAVALWIIPIIISNILGYIYLNDLLRLSTEPIAVFLALPYLSKIKTGKGVVFKFLTWISTISYSMYLLNYNPVNRILEIDRIQLLISKYHWLPFVIYLTVSFGGAYLLYSVIEKPFMQLRDRMAFKGLNKIEEKKELAPLSME